MKKYIPTVSLALSILIALIAISYAASAGRQRQDAEREADALREQIEDIQHTTPAFDPAAEADLGSAESDTNLVAELEAELTALRAELAALQQNQPEQRESREDRMARMKEEDPEGYAEMIKQRAERREAMRYGLAERTANFLELDTDFMTDDERDNHELLIQKMGDFWTLTEQFQDPEQRPDRETMMEMRSLMEEVRPLMDAERSTMFRQLAGDLGIEGEEAQEFSAYVEDIIHTTTLQMPRGGRGAPPR